MKSNVFIAVLLLCCTTMMGFKNLTGKGTGNNGTLYVKFKHDPNKGNIHLTVRSASGTVKLADVQLAPNEVFEKTFTGLATGTQSWYLVSVDWPNTDFHNQSAGTGSTIANGFPVTANNAIASWQIAGTGAFGSIPILLP